MKRLLLVLILAASALPHAAAQDTEFLYNFYIEMDGPTFLELGQGESAVFPFTFHDTSRDDGDGIGVPNADLNQFMHMTSWDFEVLSGDANGWTLVPPSTLITYAGSTASSEVRLQPSATLSQPYFEVLVNATMRDTRTGFEVTHGFVVSVLTAGIDGFSATPQGSLVIGPREVAGAQIKINNFALLPRTYEAELTGNPCNVRVAALTGTTLQGRTQEVIQLDVQGPEERFWYGAEDCSVTMNIYDVNNPTQPRPIKINIQVQGGYIDPTWVFWTVGIILASVLVFLLVARRKARIEEEILGKPQKPWHIPVEKVYLEHLRERDPQAHYVVRHFLMEEEYASAMAWYREFKRGTKGTRAKERLVVGQEHKVARFRKKWNKRIAAPIKKADRVEAKLQKKLDRRGSKDLKGDRKKWKKLVTKMEAAYNKKVEKATQKWEKAAAKAEKKERPVPEKPALTEPAYPAEPTGEAIKLKDHKWQKKADKARAKAVKKQGNLEVRFEKKESRFLSKIRRRVAKIAKKLDDPEFVENHPLLTDS